MGNIKDLIDKTSNKELRRVLYRALQQYDTMPDNAHGRYHIENVIRAAHKLNNNPGQIDRLNAAAVLHDIGNLSGRESHEIAGANESKKLLQFLSNSDKRAILHAIRQHRYTSGKPRTNLAKIINDADTISDFEAADDPDYFTRRLIQYRVAHNYPLDSIQEEAREYAKDWLTKALKGNLRRDETLSMYKQQMTDILQKANNKNEWDKYTKPMLDKELGYKKTASALSINVLVDKMVKTAVVDEELITKIKDTFYADNDPAHGWDKHVNIVRDRARDIAKAIKYKNTGLVDTAAALHDIARTTHDETHEIEGAKIVGKTPWLRSRFAPKQLAAIQHAIRQHRASTGKPRTLLAKIISDADRLGSNDHIARAMEYHKFHNPEATEAEALQHAIDHIKSKYGPGGHGRRVYFPVTETMLDKQIQDAITSAIAKK